MSKAFKLKWLCIACFHSIWKDRALGLTSKDIQLCGRCKKTGICVMVHSIKVREEK